MHWSAGKRTILTIHGLFRLQYRNTHEVGELAKTQTIQRPKRKTAPRAQIRGPGKCEIELCVNGQIVRLWVEPRRTLLDALRIELGLTGTKKVCDEGQCGACTVILEGRPVYSCMTLAMECEGSAIETIENLARNGELHPIQRAFIDHDAFQCGFCTPGQIMTLKAFLDQNPDPSLEEIKRALSGNLCRCGAYLRIAQAGLDAARRLTEQKKTP